MGLPLLLGLEASLEVSGNRWLVTYLGPTLLSYLEGPRLVVLTRTLKLSISFWRRCMPGGYHVWQSDKSWDGSGVHCPKGEVARLPGSQAKSSSWIGIARKHAARQKHSRFSHAVGHGCRTSVKCAEVRHPCTEEARSNACAVGVAPKQASSLADSGKSACKPC